MTQPARITRPKAEIPSPPFLKQPPSYQLLSHDFKDYFLDPNPNISDLGRWGVGASLGIAPFVAVIALFSGGCGGKAAFSQSDQDAGRPPETNTDEDGDRHLSIKSGGDDCDDTNARVNPKALEVCNGMDDNCDGQIDEAIGAETFYTGAEGTGNRGECRAGVERCINGKWRITQDEAVPGEEVCNGLDDDCDGETDEGIPTEDFYTGAKGTLGVGECSSGIRGCIDGAFNVLLEESPPQAEICNGLDDDCDGETDEDIARTESYSGPDGTLGVGICEAAVQECIGGILEESEEVLPQPEVCDSIDNDCDGEIDVWTWTHNGPTDERDSGSDIAIGPDGNVYVTGYEAGSEGGINAWIQKMDPDGNEIWTQIYNGAGDEQDMGLGIAVDTDGNVYVSGVEVAVPGEGFNIWIRKMDPDGNEIWTRTHNGPGSSNRDIGYDITAGADGVYVAGVEGASGSEDAWIRKMDFDGNEIWTRSYNGPANGNDSARAIALDLSGSLYVTGQVSVPGEDINIWIRKMDSDGNEIWTRTHNGTGNGQDVGIDIAIGPDGNVYITGTEYETARAEGQNIWIRKMDPDGNEIWTRTHSGTMVNGGDFGGGLALDLGGNVYVTGFEEHPFQGLNIWLNKYDSNGIPLWDAPITHDGPGSDEDTGNALAPDAASGALYLIGMETGAGEGGNILIKKYFCNGQ